MKKFLVLILIVGLVSLQSSAHAVEITGTVDSVDHEGSKMRITYVNPETAEEEQRDVLVKPETAVTGIVSFFDIQEGALIMLDAVEDPATGVWVANALRVMGEEGDMTEEVPADEEDFTAVDPDRAPEGSSEDLSEGPASR